MTDYIYDIECYPNIFSIGFKNGEQYTTYEISWRRNEIPGLMLFLRSLAINKDRMIGFNNLGYDYPVIHFIIENQHDINPLMIYTKSSAIINTPFDQRFNNIIWDRDQHIQQIDLFKIHHFDNVSKSTSLKILEFNMRSDFIEDLPFPPGRLLNWSECDELISYMGNDINETEKFYHHTSKQIAFREELTARYNRNFLNHNDTKIGKDYFIMELEKVVPNFNRRNQTPRDSIKVSDIIFPYINFNNSEFKRILSWFNTQIIIDTKGAFKDVNCTIKGFQFDFGTGGIHGSVDSQIVEADEENIILDIDVKSFYPNIAIANRLYPEHLSESFCDIYRDVYNQRLQYEKGTTENAMLKLALNGVFGDSNNKYSPFYDPQYTMSITINGQLLLCMLAETLMQDDRIQMIQINTDGLTVKCPRYIKSWIDSVCQWWESVTKLELEYAEYSRMFVRDVNNYIAEYTDGKLKRKGVYGYDRKEELQWHQNHSALVVPTAAEAALVHGKDIREFIENHQDIFDFMLRTKVPRNSKLVTVDYSGTDHRKQNVSRYYISVMGGDLVKIMPPTATQIKKGKTADRRIGVNAGWKVTECNDINKCNPDDIEFDFYVKECEKLVNPLTRKCK